MKKTERQCGTTVMKLLKNYGTEFVFGIPGVHTIELYRGIADAGLTHVTPRHEQSAGFMADGYARATGKVGVCCLITGPGVTNAATALAQSYSDSIPVLAISSVNKTQSLELGQGDLHEVPAQQKLTEHFTAFSQTILDVNSVPEVLARAYAVFGAMRARPVHIEFPIDLIEEFVEWTDSPAARSQPSLPSIGLLETAAATLEKAKNPVLILGGGCKDIAAEIQLLLAKLQATVVTTFAAKGVVAETHPLSLGANLLHPPVLDFIAAADVVLAIGTQLSETDIWHRGGDIHFDGTLIRIDIDAEQLYRNAIPDLPILGDAKFAVEQLADLMQDLRVSKGLVRQRKTQVKKLLSACQRHWYSYTSIHAPIWDVIRKVLPENGIVVTDSTQLVYSGNYYYQALQPRKYLTSTTGFGTLGYALPAAIGAKLGKPECPVVCVVGDGGLMFTLSELATAVEHELPIAIVLWHNDGYGEIRKHFKQHDVALVGVDLGMPDFVTLAQGFGCKAKRIQDLKSFETALNDTFYQRVPTLLELRAELFS